MARIRVNFVGGTITDNPLTDSAGSMNAVALGALPIVTAPDILVLVLDPEGVTDVPEIVWVTAHSSLATTATIERGQEDTLAREHPSGTFWIHAPTAEDFSSSEGSLYLRTTFR